ncbi:MAG: membrane protein insertase YidC [Phycisphaerales bacterium]|nr:membrane protein insertase YidC [Planctomycetota bacterium]
MPKEPNMFVRRLAVVGAILAVIAAGFAMYFASKKTTQQQVANLDKQILPPGTTPQTTPQTTQSATSPTAPTAPTPIAPAASPGAPTAAAGTAAGDLPDLKTARARVWALDPAIADAQLKGDHLAARFSSVGAGLSLLQITDHFETIERTEPVPAQREYSSPILGADGKPLKTEDGRELSRIVAPLAALGVEIDGTFVNLSVDAAGSIWKFQPPATFTAEIADGRDRPIARIVRQYSLARDARNLVLNQKIENLSGQNLSIRWLQIGPVDLPADDISIGEKRRLRFGYLLSPAYDPTQDYVLSRDYVLEHPTVLGAKLPDGSYMADITEWPNELSKERQYTLSWIGLTNRYFGVALHAPITQGATADLLRTEKRLSTIETVDRLVLQRPPVGGKPNDVIALRTSSPKLTIPPGGSADLSQSVYSGALIRSQIRADYAGGPLKLDGLVFYSMPGPCAFCTFNFLTTFLLWLLTTLHSLVHDWALSIVLLVVIVRTILHPVTKWSQVRMQRFGKQMSAMQPKQAKLKEKYGNDPKLLQQETAKLWREEGINPLGMLGCLPMFLQTPIWLALYATLFFAAELRHQPAFYGIFQKLGFKTFLADLSVPDHFWVFPSPINIPLLSMAFGPISGINLLPLVLGVVFFLHQKYLTPATTAPQTPEQEMQMKMMKWISVIMFPVLMYNGPSGLTIYFVANSALGIIEHKRIRAHIEKHDLLNLDKIRARRGKGSQPGFFGRLQQMVEQQRKAAEATARGKPRR